MKLLARFRYLFRQRQMDRDLAEEIEFHREMNGDTRAMGNVTRAREDARAVWIWPWLESVWQDLTHAFHSLRHSPGFTLVALLTLGTAIGLNTSFFTVFNAIALRPWPVADPARIVKIFSIDKRQPDASGGGIGTAEYRYFQQHARSFTGFAVTLGDEVSFGFEPFGRPSHAVLVGADHFRVLGLQMHLGRGFLPEEDRTDAPQPVTVLSFPYWHDHFNSDPAIVGKQVSANDISFTVVGVTPEDFTGTGTGGGEDVYFPLPVLRLLHSADSWVEDVLSRPDQCCEAALGRLAPGISPSQAAAELDVLDKQFFTQAGAPGGRTFTLTGSAAIEGPDHKQQAGPTLVLLFIGVTLVVLLACANVGNLLIARAGARQLEIEIRRAIGAGRARIVRQLMTESLILALGAAGLALPIAYWLPVFVISQAADVPGFHLTPDGTVLLYTLALSAFACVAFGLTPAMYGTRNRTRRRMALRSVLLAAQVALSVVLLIGAGLALQGVQHLRSHDPGFAIAGVSVVSFELPARDYQTAQARNFDKSLLDGISGLTFGITRREPLSNSRWLADFRLPGQPQNATHPVPWEEVSSGYFDVLRIPIVAGRNFQSSDSTGNAILVNQALARQYWPNDSAIGQSAVAAGGRVRQVVGIVQDAYTNGLDQTEPTFYVPFQATSIPKILVSPSGAPVVASVAARIEPRARTQALPLQEIADRWFHTARIGAEIAGMLGVYALILATVGMSGVFAYVVQQRTKEIGVRMALGARPAQVVRLVLTSSSRAAIVGLAIGIPLALICSRLMRGLLYGVNPFNPVAYVSVALVLAAAGLAASYAPARKASRVDPLQALRHE